MTRDEARKTLLGMLKPGDTVYTLVRHVSRSGMQRSISLFVMDEGRPFDISGMAARAIEARFDDKRGGVKMGGCGMDVCLHAVQCLGTVLWPDGWTCIGEKCPSNDHFNGDRNYAPHQHKSGAYAIRKSDM